MASPCLAGDPMVTWRAWGIPVRCGAGMVALQTLLALYRFGDSTALLQLVNPLMWIGLGLFFVTGWVIGWVVERLLRGTTGRFRTLPAGRDVPGHPRGGRREPRGGTIRPSWGPALWPDPVSPPGGDSQTDWGRVDPAWLLSFRKQSTNNSRRRRTSHRGGPDRPAARPSTPGMREVRWAEVVGSIRTGGLTLVMRGCPRRWIDRHPTTHDRKEGIGLM